MNVADGRKTVTTAGTRVKLSSESLSIESVAITALEGNEGTVCVGGKTVVAKLETRTGVPLAAKQTVSIDTDDIGDIWIDSTKNGEGVSWLAVTDA